MRALRWARPSTERFAGFRRRLTGTYLGPRRHGWAMSRTSNTHTRARRHPSETSRASDVRGHSSLGGKRKSAKRGD